MSTTLPHAISVTRPKLYGMFCVALTLAVVAFQVGRSWGHLDMLRDPQDGTSPDALAASAAGQDAAPAGEAAGTAAPKLAPILPDEARTAQLEALLARVELREKTGASSAGDLRKALEAKSVPLGLGPDGVPVEPERGPFNEKILPATPPPPDPFPDAPRTAGGSVTPGAAVQAPASLGKVPADGWAVEVGSFPAESEARARVEALTAAGLPAYALPGLVASQTTWRVRVGGYPDKDAASGALASVRSRAGAGAATVVRAP